MHRSLPRPLVLLFASACGLSVANVYYAHPLLDTLSQQFAIDQAAVGGVVTATQLGCALALLLLVPLGDMFDRRRLMAFQGLGLTAALVAVAAASTPVMLLAGMLAVGALGTAMTQGLIACAASAAAPQERGRVVGAAQGGVFLGLLLARLFAGLVSDLAGWRSVYLAAAAMMLVLAGLLWRHLPVLAPPALRLGYRALLGSMLQLLREERVLQVRGTLALLMFAALNIFWTALTLPLSAPPYTFSHTAIGAFGLAGAFGALAAARAGRWADQGLGQRTSAVALGLMVLAWGPLALMPRSLWALVLGIVLLDMGAQALHVTSQSLVFRTRTDAHSRLVGLYMLFYAAGSGAGAIGATCMFAWGGWGAVCALGACVSTAAWGFWWADRQWQAGRRRRPPGDPVPTTGHICRRQRF